MTFTIVTTKTEQLSAPKYYIIFAAVCKKVVSDSPGLVDFAIWLVNSVVNLPDGQVMFFEQFELQKEYEIKSIWD